MSIANLEHRGIRNEGKQIIQRPIALNSQEELNIYNIAFNNVLDTGPVINGVISVIKEGQEGYLPKFDVSNGIELLENGLYGLEIQVKNLGSISSPPVKYKIVIKEDTTIVLQAILDLTSKGPIFANEYTVFEYGLLNHTSGGMKYLNAEIQCIEGTQASSNYQAFLTILRLK